MLEDSPLNGEFGRLSDAGVGIAPADLAARGSEVADLSDQLLSRLRDGL
jgi:hypothetical protein